MFAHRTTYRIHTTPAHVTLMVWVNGGKCGELCVRVEEVDVLNALIATLERNGATNNRAEAAE